MMHCRYVTICLAYLKDLEVPLFLVTSLYLDQRLSCFGEVNIKARTIFGYYNSKQSDCSTELYICVVRYLVQERLDKPS